MGFARRNFQDNHGQATLGDNLQFCNLGVRVCLNQRPNLLTNFLHECLRAGTVLNLVVDNFAN